MLTDSQIKFLNRVCPNRWTEENNVINVDGDINIQRKKLTQIPVQFGKISGTFECSSNELTTLYNSPKIVNGYYGCENNNLINLINAPIKITGNFYCRNNKLTSLEGCPQLIMCNLICYNNPNLKYLWGIGRVEGDVYYDNENEINEWIIKLAREDIIFPYSTLEENINWIKQEQKYSILLGAPEKIRQYFSPRILHLVNSGVYNESRILDYKNFMKIC